MGQALVPCLSAEVSLQDSSKLCWRQALILFWDGTAYFVLGRNIRLMRISATVGLTSKRSTAARIASARRLSERFWSLEFPSASRNGCMNSKKELFGISRAPIARFACRSNHRRAAYLDSEVAVWSVSSRQRIRRCVISGSPSKRLLLSTSGRNRSACIRQ